MYSTLEDSRRADERAAAQGYEVEDWAQNDLGTAVGWWTPGHDIHADDEASERRGALRTALRNHRRGDATPVDVSEADDSSSNGEESDGGQAARDVAGLRARGGELARAERAQDATRTLAAIKALGERHPALATLKGATATTKLLGRMGRKAPNRDVRRAARECDRRRRGCGGRRPSRGTPRRSTASGCATKAASG